MLRLTIAGLLAWTVLPAQGPVVVNTTPRSQDPAVPAGTPVVWTFDRALDPATLAGNVRMTGRWSGEIPVTASLDGTGTVLTVRAGRAPFAGETVTVWAADGVQDTSGQALTGGHALQYWIRPSPGSGNLALDRKIDLQRPGEGSIVTYGIFPGDVDGDGAPDMLASNEGSGDVRVLLQDGCAVLGPMTVFADPGQQPSPTEGADLDGNGTMDIVTGNAGAGTVSVYLGNGDGTLAPPFHLSPGGFVHGLAMLDADGDGSVDIATANQTRVLVYYNDGTAAFPAVRTFDAGSGEDNVQVADADGDGHLDVFVGNLSGSTIAILRNDGQGGFTLGGSQSTLSGNPFQNATGDVDGDGLVDAVTANRIGADQMVVHRGDGNGGFSGSPTAYPTGSTPTAVDLGDIDGDGDLDCVVSCYNTSDFWVYWNDGQGGFSAFSMLPSTQAASCASVVDFDRDGDMDLMCADEVADEAILFVQGGPSPAGVQPASCAATLRLDQLAGRAGFGGAAAQPVVAGHDLHVGITGPASAAFAVGLGARDPAGTVLPQGRLHLDPSLPIQLVLNGFGGPHATDVRGEAAVRLAVPAGLPAGSTATLQAVVLDPATGSLLLSNPEQAVFR